MSTSKLGLNRMHQHILQAPGDIRHRLWSLYWLVRMTRQTGIVVELGTRGGDTARAFLSACLDVNSYLCSYDIEDCSQAVRDEQLRRFWYFQKMDSVKAGLEWPKSLPSHLHNQPNVKLDAYGGIDLVFIDTDHTFKTTRAEIAAWHQHVRVGGCLAFHDYWLYDPPRDEHQGRGVKLAVDEFTDRRPGEWKLETWDAGPDGDTGFALAWRLK